MADKSVCSTAGACYHAFAVDVEWSVLARIGTSGARSPPNARSFVGRALSKSLDGKVGELRGFLVEHFGHGAELNDSLQVDRDDEKTDGVGGSPNRIFIIRGEALHGFSGTMSGVM